MSEKQLSKMLVELTNIGIPVGEGRVIIDLMTRKSCRSLRGLLESYKHELYRDVRFSVPTQMFFRVLVGQKCYNGYDQGHFCAIFYKKSLEDLAKFNILVHNFWQNKFLSNFLTMHNQRRRFIQCICIFYRHSFWYYYK